MNISILQVNLHWKQRMELADKMANIETVASLVDETCGRGPTDLILMPEFAFTGPISTLSDPEALVVSDARVDPAFQTFSASARAHRAAIVIPIFLRELDGSFSNCACWIDERGNLAGVYRKIHPFPPEKGSIRPGADVETIDTKFGPVGMQICYDVAFPETARLLALKGAGVLVYPTFAEDGVMDYFEPLARARAIENQVFVVLANGVGTHPRTGNPLSGRSLIATPSGSVHGLGTGEKVENITLDLSQVAKTRQVWFTLVDRNPRAYGGLSS
ncbi:MAG: carbon-nitrogen hydrolase family protein [Chloroflexi bacterium]|nr:carbon-nitrogen hydrolase family protein [Chloroflexota bacterium]